MSNKEIKKRQNKGFYIILVSMAGAFASMWLLGLFGTGVSSTIDALKFLVPYLWIALGSYGVGYTVSGKKGGMKGVKIFVTIFVVAIAIGFLMRL